MGKSLKEILAEQKAARSGPSFGGGVAAATQQRKPDAPAPATAQTAPDPYLAGITAKLGASAPAPTGVKFGAKAEPVKFGVKNVALSDPHTPAMATHALAEVQTKPAPATNPNAFQQAADELRASLEYLRENIEHPDILGATVRNIARQLIAMPELHPLMQNTDANLVVRALRASYQTAARVKQEKTTRKSSKNQMLDEAEKLMKEMGFGSDGDGTPDVEFGF